MKITMNGQVIDVADGTRIIELIEGDKYQYQAARVNNRIRELNYIIQEDSEIELLTLKDRESQIMYQSTLRYLIVMAAKRIYPSAVIKFNYSVSRALSATTTASAMLFVVMVYAKDLLVISSPASASFHS